MKVFLALLLIASIGFNAYMLRFVDNNNSGFSNLKSSFKQDVDSLVYRNDQIKQELESVKKELQDITTKYDVYHRYIESMEKNIYTGTYLGEYEKNPKYIQAEIRTGLFKKEIIYFELSDNARNDLVINKINYGDNVDIIYFKTRDSNEAPFNHYVVYRIRKHIK